MTSRIVILFGNMRDQRRRHCERTGIGGAAVSGMRQTSRRAEARHDLRMDVR